jgi:hypothetical protein
MPETKIKEDYWKLFYQKFNVNLTKISKIEKRIKNNLKEKIWDLKHIFEIAKDSFILFLVSLILNEIKGDPKYNWIRKAVKEAEKELEEVIKIVNPKDRRYL